MINRESNWSLFDFKMTDIEYQLQFTKTAADISNIFINLPPAEIDRGIMKALRLCGEFFGVQRSYLFQRDPDGKFMSNTYEWCAEGIEPQKEQLQNLPVKSFSWQMNQLKQHGFLYIPEVSKLPDSAQEEKELFLNLGLSSVILIALMVEGEARGFFGFDLPDGSREWKKEEISLLKIVTDTISAATIKGYTDKELQNREEMFRSISENAFDMITLIGINGNFIYCNKSYVSILGYDPTELIGTYAFDLIHPADKNKAIQLFREGIEKKRGFATLLLRIICNDGSFRWVEHRVKLLFNVDDQPEKILILARDVTDSKISEDQLILQRNLGLKLSATSDLNEALDYCLEAALKLSSMDSGGIYLFDKSTGYLELNCYRGLSTDFYKSRSSLAPDSSQVNIVRTGKPYYIENVGTIPENEAVIKEGLTAIAVIPVKYENEIVGCINVASHSLNSIPPSTRLTLETIVAQIGSAIGRIQAEQRHKESVKKYQTLVSNVPGIIFSCEMDEGLTMRYLSGDFEELTGYKVSDFVDSKEKTYNSIIYPEDREYVYNTIMSCDINDQPYHVRYRITTADGRLRWFRESGRLVLGNNNSNRLIDGVIIDITDLKSYEEQLRYLSLHDQLTGLYNRTFFETEMDRLENSREYPISVISTDLDGLKLINDTMGHHSGDRLLKAAGDLLHKSLRSSDMLARIGGDEYAALLPNTDHKTSEKIAKRIRNNIARHNSENPDMPISLSLGLATAADNEAPLQAIFKMADDLMYRDKLYSSYSVRNKVVNSLMTALAERDYITEGHAARLQEICMMLGEKLNLNSSQLSDLALLSQVHDLGKVGIPDKILFKPGKLEDDEWEVMKMHLEKGYRIALSSHELSSIADLVLKHHERWDGKGYPLGLKGEEIPLLCRILSVVDAFDAMTHDRPYQVAVSDREALAELKRFAGKQFDPHIVDLFIQLQETAK